MYDAGSIDITSRISDRFQELSPKQKKIARFVLENQYFVAFASAAEVGEQVGVSAATVVRFCQALGLEGYPELQKAIRVRLPHSLTAVQRGERELSTSRHAPGDVFQRTFTLDIQNLQRTLAEINSAQFETAVHKLAAAERVLVVGTGVSAGPAQHLAHCLRVMGYDTHCVTTGGIPLAVELTQLNERGLLIAISMWRYVRDTVEAVHRARAQNIPRVTITDSIFSPLAQAEHNVLIVSTEGPAHTLSLTATLSLINALTAAVSHLHPERTLEALRAIDRSYRLHRLVLAEGES